MKRYRVTTKEVHEVEWIVTADTAEEAEAKVYEGRGVPTRRSYEYTLRDETRTEDT